MSWETRRLRLIGSGSIFRIWAAARRGILNLLGLHAVLRARLLAVADAGGVQRAADHLVTEARQVLDAATAHEHDRVLLQVVTLAGNVGADLHPVGQTDTGDLAKRRVRLLRGDRVHARAHPATLRRGDLLLAALARLQARGRQLLLGRRAPFTDQLTGGRHSAAECSRDPLTAVIPPCAPATPRSPAAC